MVLFYAQSSNKRVKADVLILPFWKEQNRVRCAAPLSDDYASLSRDVLEDFSGKVGSSEFFYSLGSLPEKRVLLLGLGQKEHLVASDILEAYARATRAVRKSKCKTVNIVMPILSELRMPVEEFVQSVVAGVLSLNYEYPKYMKDQSQVNPPITRVNVYGIVPKIADHLFRREENIFEGVYLTRDLVNGNADDVTPAKLAHIAQGLAKQFPNLTTKVLNREAILKENMGLLAAVSKGAAVDPCFIVLSYEGKPRSKDHTVLVGKGVTFDSGGLDLKPGKSMLTMKEDMAGAATVLGIITALAALNLPVNVTGIIPATENAIGSAAYKMGDVYTGMSGLSVEIGSTDAEGRLILADAISYALKYCHPTRIIDFATLTGAMVVSLGEDVAGVFSNDDELAHDLLAASAETGETLWRLPLVEKYDKALCSDIADMKNIGSNRAGAITAALFLRRFLENHSVAWAHLDIAGTAYREKDEDGFPKYASGFGVRCLVQYIEQYVSK